jgi:hypothetical protein
MIEKSEGDYVVKEVRSSLKPLYLVLKKSVSVNGTMFGSWFNIVRIMLIVGDSKF